MKLKLSTFALAALLSACDPLGIDSKTNANVEDRIKGQTAEFTIDSPKLSEEFRAAPDDSRTKYDGRVLLITGKVDRTKTQMSDGGERSCQVVIIPDVTCYFAAPHAQKIIALKFGEAVTIKGRCKASGSSGVTLEGCTFQ